MKKIYIPTIDSTNKYVKNHYHNMESFTMIYSFNQTEGCGRWNRQWENGNQENIACSILIKPTPVFNQVSLLSLFTAMVVVYLLRDWNIDASVKWPNDIFIDNKKVAGILIETIHEKKLEAIIIGIGININAKAFHFVDNAKATSVFLSENKTFSLQEGIDKICYWMEKMYPLFEKDPKFFLEEYQQLHILSGKKIKLDNKNYLVSKVMMDGSLLLVGEKENRIINNGEITFQDEYDCFIK
ncbi:MAG: biotin--[acetyl-CoA-carboxylase] ligase [Bacilli bacterium]|nr:biotin--[acetyl-CoA-carboxylase] ligase [Bacilli bacterium]